MALVGFGAVVRFESKRPPCEPTTTWRVISTKMQPVSGVFFDNVTLDTGTRHGPRRNGSSSQAARHQGQRAAGQPRYKKTSHMGSPALIRWRRRRDSPGAPRPHLAARRAALAGCAGKRVRVSSAPPPPGFESCKGHKKTSHMGSPALIRWRRRRDSNPRTGSTRKRFSRPPHSTTLPLLRIE